MKKNTLIITILCLLQLTLWGQTNYYVANNGNDNNSGTLNAPWKTFVKAANAATPGSTVHFRAGVYEKAFIGVSGTPGNYITFKNYGCEQAIIDGGSTNTNTTLIGIDNKSYIRIQGLTLRNAIGNYSSGIYIINGSHHLEIIENTISNIHFDIDPNKTVNSNRNSTPLVVYNENPTQSCNNISIRNNEVFDCRTGFSEALSLGGNVEDFEVIGNVVHDITNIGIDVTGGYGVSPDPTNDFSRNGIVSENVAYNCVSAYAVSAGIYVDGGQNVVVERNRSYQNGRGFEIGSEEFGHETKNVILRNNLSYRNLEAGIGIGGYDYPNTGKVVDCQILNNTFYDNNTRDINFEGELLIEYTENCTIENNIFYAKNTPNFLLVSRLNSQNIQVNYNNYYHENGSNAVRVDWEGAVYTGFSNYQSGTGQDGQSQFANPLFFQAASDVFQLQAGSPVIDAGNPAFVPAMEETDFLGWSRVLAGRVDQGAYEGSIMECPKDQELAGNILGPIYQVSENITATGTINIGTTVKLQGETIQLSPNFHAKTGSNFTAKVAPCTADNLFQPSLLSIALPAEEKAEQLLFKVYPNPLRNTGYIDFELVEDQDVSIRMFNLKGQLVKNLVQQKRYKRGIHQLTINGQQFERGLYLIKIQTATSQEIRKITIP